MYSEYFPAEEAGFLADTVRNVSLLIDHCGSVLTYEVYMPLLVSFSFLLHTEAV